MPVPVFISIGSDFYEKGQMSLFQDEETVRRINVFDWEKEFPGIFQQGGFDEKERGQAKNPLFVSLIRVFHSCPCPFVGKRGKRERRQGKGGNRRLDFYLCFCYHIFDPI